MSSNDYSKVLGERVAKFLRQRHPIKTAASVAAETPFSAYRVGKWLELASVPNGPALLVLTAVYGPEFLAAVMPQRFEWLDEGVRAQRRERLKAEIAARERELESLAP